MAVEPSSARDEPQPGGQSPAGGVPCASGAVPRRVAGTVGVLVTAWVILTGLLILVGEGIEHSSALSSMDRTVTAFVVGHRTPALNQLMQAVTWTGSWIATLAVAVLVIVLAWTRRLAVLVVIAVLGGWSGQLLAVHLTKAVVQRARPPEPVRLVVAHGWALPSGHTANAVVMFATGAFVVTTFLGHRNARLLTWVLAVLVTALVGFSRIELGVHWLTDVVASLVWTTCWLLILVTVLWRTRRLEVVRRRAVCQITTNDAGAAAN